MDSTYARCTVLSRRSARTCQRADARRVPTLADPLACRHSRVLRLAFSDDAVATDAHVDQNAIDAD